MRPLKENCETRSKREGVAVCLEKQEGVFTESPHVYGQGQEMRPV